MVGAGLTTGRALKVLEAQLGRGPSRVAAGLAQLIDGGSTLAGAMQAFPRCFDELSVALVAAGEVAGQLDQSLVLLADSLEEDLKVRNQVRAGLVYPLVVLHAAVFVPPVVELVTEGLGAYVRAVLPSFLGVYALLGAVALVGALERLAPPLADLLGFVRPWVPLYGGLVRKRAQALFLRNLGGLLEGGLPTARAIEIAARSCGNAWMAGRFASGAERVDQGGTVSEALAASGLLGKDLLAMVVAGEESGRLGTMLRKAAEYQQDAYRRSLQALLAVLPTLALLGVGLYVAKLYVARFLSLMAPLKEILPP